MKKAIYILFALFYLTLATKVSASIHFCGGSITNISFYEHSNDDVCECGKMTDNSCCNEVTVQWKTDESNTNLQKQINFNFLQKFIVLTSSFYQLLFAPNHLYQTSNFYIFDHKPPLILVHLSSIFLRI